MISIVEMETNNGCYVLLSLPIQLLHGSARIQFALSCCTRQADFVRLKF